MHQPYYINITKIVPCMIYCLFVHLRLRLHYHYIRFHVAFFYLSHVGVIYRLLNIYETKNLINTAVKDLPKLILEKIMVDQPADHADDVLEIGNQLYPVDEFNQLSQNVANFQNI